MLKHDCRNGLMIVVEGDDITTTLVDPVSLSSNADPLIALRIVLCRVAFVTLCSHARE